MGAAKRVKLNGHQAAYLNQVNIKLKILHLQKENGYPPQWVSKTMVG